ncbi:YHS domain-containing protein [Trichloromonas sp.]|uniref:YHS domain-containing protein n=1 Tax=Trichloromonas sp. TaxID=3069249 RepID=UPI002A3EA06D|nr:YHS domain-containing protein [Trichloromonas sp.]
MIKLLIFALLGFLAYTFYTLLRRSLGGGTPAIPPEKTRQGEEMVRDPQCGTYLPKGDALEEIIDGERYYFCSARCRDAFKAKKR